MRFLEGRDSNYVRRYAVFSRLARRCFIATFRYLWRVPVLNYFDEQSLHTGPERRRPLPAARKSDLPGGGIAQRGSISSRRYRPHTLFRAAAAALISAAQRAFRHFGRLKTPDIYDVLAEVAAC